MVTSPAIDLKESPRERILAAARELFYRRGIHSVSVDEVASAAGSNKMTLYRHFGSKDRLIVEWLTATAEGARALWQEVETTHPDDAMARLRALVDMMVDQISEWMRGCPFGNSLAELSAPDHPAYDVIRRYFAYQREWLERTCREAGLARPDETADALFYIIRGTSTGLILDNADEFAKRERRALTAVIDASV
jgi:AcrR family transcriptional regulator